MNASSRVSAFSADNLGIWASALCLVHCIVTPVLISASAVFAHFIPGEEKTHRTPEDGIAAVGAIALIKGVRTNGRRLLLGLLVHRLGLTDGGAFYDPLLPAPGAEGPVTL